ncbi:MAG TPA: ComEC/Rec2 family competence protein, partial [Kofleriaceae bacterium]|nr:ComEC/Rec2 family competence protein [Kofleriaceae bacterium]
ILLWRPQDLFDPSFQLSFTAALTLALRPRTRSGSRIRRWLVGGLSTSAWVALTTAPITALHFHQVAAGGVIGNLVLTPIVELVALPLGLAGVLLGGLGAPLVTLAVWIVARVDQLAGLLAHAIPVGTIALGSRPLVIVLVVLSLWLASRARRTRRGLVVWAALCCGWLFGRSPPPNGALRVTFFDVGQGDAALVELPGGTTWLVDAGGVASARTIDAATAPGTMIRRALELYGHDAIDLAIVSHPHPDHYLGLAAIDMPVRELWAVTDGEAAGPSGGLPSFEGVVDNLVEQGTYLGHPHLGNILTSDGVELTLLAPRWQPFDGAAPQLAADPVRSVNDNSLVIEVRYAGRTLLFTGDIETEGEQALVQAGLGHVDIVKVAHHGSPTSSSMAFVEATSPAYAVISCGVANAFGFPSEEVLARWRGTGARIERTDLDGAITAIVGSDGSLDVERFAP